MYESVAKLPGGEVAVVKLLATVEKCGEGVGKCMG